MATDQKKGKKDRKANKLAELEDFDMEAELNKVEEPAVDVSSKKAPESKSKNNRKGKAAKHDDSGEDEEGKDTEEVSVAAPQKKAPELKNKKTRKGKTAAQDDSDDEDEVKDVVEIPMTAPPKKAPESKTQKTGKSKNIAQVDSDVDENEEDANEPVEVSLVPKKPADIKGKKGRKGKNVGLEDSDEEEKKVEEVEAPVVVEAPKKAEVKGKKGRKDKNFDLDDIERELAEVAAGAPPEKKPAEIKAEPKTKGKNVASKVEAAADKSDVEEDDDRTSKSKPAAKAGKAAPKVAVKKTEDTGAPVKAAVSSAKESDNAAAGTTEKKDAPAKKKTAAELAKDKIRETLRKEAEERERLERAEDERIRLLEEADQRRLDELQKEKEKKEKKKEKEKERKQRLKDEGKLLTTKQKQDKARGLAMLEDLKARGIPLPGAGEKATRSGKNFGPKKAQPATTPDGTEKSVDETAAAEDDGAKSEVSEESIPDDWDQVSEGEVEADGSQLVTPKPVSKAAAAGPVIELPSEAKEAANVQKLDTLRSPVVCVLGHVDTGKTKILDKIRRTNVQDMEAGGITQQIGATMIPADAIRTQCSMAMGFLDMKLRLPGLLIIDTPGHESFSNLRSRGSSLCDIAILVVDIMHGLEPQTIESLNMLKKRRTPFVVALNKIDRLFGWKAMPKADVMDAIASQTANTKQEFRDRSQKIIVEFAEQGTNAALFRENPDETFGDESFISMVPTSAVSGDGMGNLMAYLVDVSQRMLTKRLTFTKDLSCTVLEVKELTGLGTTIDVILTNGTLHEGDTIVVAGFEGPIVTQIKGLLMPQPLREMRVKNPYEKYKKVDGAQGIKILAKDLESCLAGLPLLVANTPDEQERCKEATELELAAALKSMNYQREDRGVYVQASTLGSLEALLEFLRTSKIPYSGVNIGPVHKKDVRNASTMLEHETQYAVILAFDVKVEREAQQLADELGVRIFAADIIYHLFDRFTAYQDELKAQRREENKHLAIFPCKLKILPQFVFNSRDPIVVGVVVEAGILKVGTPLCVPTKEFVDIGVVSSIELNHKPLEMAKKGQEVCIKIEPDPGSAPKLLGRHFEIEDVMVSRISRASIDCCKDYFRDDLGKPEWQLMVELKKAFSIF
ncbi:Eukaryotic translation initiation factor 5B [Hypsibius exemplaris]|uniref:Eukaryotic translation initiation factor 5B n=1 Tax=Hypsibius exemplaris TaxID=2072580 RepID=A0A1W0X7L1_HYPEX|nr:Eukaryotic translation initiation factor 5B [Hypsibius exemplaris]